MRLHILGICGTFMGGIAALARSAGHEVSGSDSGVYPPMSEQLAALGIAVQEGYTAAQLAPPPDCVVIGNVMSRGNPAVEEVLNRGLPYRSGPQWLAENILRGKWVLAVSGTHGKTTTSSMLAWILEYAGMAPGFLIGGVPQNFGVSARNTDSKFFVVEADEYDTAFFDKRSKFVHYQPRTLVLNNLEFDHADIFPDLDAIKQQFHHLLRTLPGEGLLVHAGDDENVADVINQGCWTPRESFTVATQGDANVGESEWRAVDVVAGGSSFTVEYAGESQGQLSWRQSGLHNVANAVAAIAAARHAGVPVTTSLKALAEFAGVARRMQLLADHQGVRVFDDFAHHPTAIASTLQGVRAAKQSGRIIAVLEPRSNTMKMGVHKAQLAEALAAADKVLVFANDNLSWEPAVALEALGEKLNISHDTGSIMDDLVAGLRPGDDVIIMSNGGFDGLPKRLADAVNERAIER